MSSRRQPGVHSAPATLAPALRGRRRLWAALAAGVLVVAGGGVGAALLLPDGGPDPVAAPTTATATATAPSPITVAAVADGDTVELDTEGGPQAVTLLSAHAPVGEECLAPEAQSRLAELLPAGTVVGELQVHDRTDTDGTPLATFPHEDGTVAAALLAEGLAVPRDGDGTGAEAPTEAALAATTSARDGGLGLFDPAVDCTLPATVAAQIDTLSAHPKEDWTLPVPDRLATARADLATAEDVLAGITDPAPESLYGVSSLSGWRETQAAELAAQISATTDAVDQFEADNQAPPEDEEPAPPEDEEPSSEPSQDSGATDGSGSEDGASGSEDGSSGSEDGASGSEDGASGSSGGDAVDRDQENASCVGDGIPNNCPGSSGGSGPADQDQDSASCVNDGIPNNCPGSNSGNSGNSDSSDSGDSGDSAGQEQGQDDASCVGDGIPGNCGDSSDGDSSGSSGEPTENPTEDPTEGPGAEPAGSSSPGASPSAPAGTAIDSAVGDG